jgi:hypothetical protein
MQAIPIQTTCVSLKFAYRCTSPIFREIGEIGGNLAITDKPLCLLVLDGGRVRGLSTLELNALSAPEGPTRNSVSKLTR